MSWPKSFNILKVKLVAISNLLIITKTFNFSHLPLKEVHFLILGLSNYFLKTITPHIFQKF